MITINLSLRNSALYRGCEIHSMDEKFNLATPMDIASPIARWNAKEILGGIDADQEIELTGRMAVWVYPIVFSEAVKRFRRVSFFNGETRIPISKTFFPA